MFICFPLLSNERKTYDINENLLQTYISHFLRTSCKRERNKILCIGKLSRKLKLSFDSEAYYVAIGSLLLFFLNNIFFYLLLPNKARKGY